MGWPSFCGVCWPLQSVPGSQQVDAKWARVWWHTQADYSLWNSSKTGNVLTCTSCCPQDLAELPLSLRETPLVCGCTSRKLFLLRHDWSSFSSSKGSFWAACSVCRSKEGYQVFSEKEGPLQFTASRELWLYRVILVRHNLFVIVLPGTLCSSYNSLSDYFAIVLNCFYTTFGWSDDHTHKIFW